MLLQSRHFRHPWRSHTKKILTLYYRAQQVSLALNFRTAFIWGLFAQLLLNTQQTVVLSYAVRTAQ